MKDPSRKVPTAKSKKNDPAKRGGYWPIVLAAVPLLALLAAALLHWTMQVFLEPNLLVRVVKLIGLPFYILFVVATPPLLLAGVFAFVCRKSNTVFGIVALVATPIWGFWYLIPPIAENWAWFLEFVERFGPI